VGRAARRASHLTNNVGYGQCIMIQQASPRGQTGFLEKKRRIYLAMINDGGAPPPPPLPTASRWRPRQRGAKNSRAESGAAA